jgi:hypothetical protein
MTVGLKITSEKAGSLGQSSIQHAPLQNALFQGYSRSEVNIGAGGVEPRSAPKPKRPKRSDLPVSRCHATNRAAILIGPRRSDEIYVAH